jgi:hypothetical protein
MPSTTATLLLGLERIEHETRDMLFALDDAASANSPNRHEVKRRLLEIRESARELTTWLGEVRLDEPAN